MNIGLLVGQTLLLPLPSGLRIAALMDRSYPNPLMAAETLDKLQLVPNLNPAMTYLSGR